MFTFFRANAPIRLQEFDSGVVKSRLQLIIYTPGSISPTLERKGSPLRVRSSIVTDKHRDQFRERRGDPSIFPREVVARGSRRPGSLLRIPESRDPGRDNGRRGPAFIGLTVRAFDRNYSLAPARRLTWLPFWLNTLTCTRWYRDTARRSAERVSWYQFQTRRRVRSSAKACILLSTSCATHRY